MDLGTLFPLLHDGQHIVDTLGGCPVPLNQSATIPAATLAANNSWLIPVLSRWVLTCPSGYAPPPTSTGDKGGVIHMPELLVDQARALVIQPSTTPSPPSLPPASLSPILLKHIPA